MQHSLPQTLINIQVVYLNISNNKKTCTAAEILD